MASFATAPEVSPRAILRMPLRTYSRRSLKRRHTLSPISDTERTIRRAKSFSAATSQPAVTNQKAPTTLTANTGRAYSRFPGSAKEDKTPNDLAWEALTLSAPFLTQQHVEKAADEPHLAKETEDRQSDIGEAIDDSSDGQDKFDPIVEEQVPQQDASQHEAPEDISSEGSSGGNDSSEPDEDIEVDNTALTSSSEGGKSYFSATLGMQKPRMRAAFLVFDKCPPEGFKVLKKRKASPVHKTPATKGRNKPSDGFSAEEARPSHLGRRRRLHHLDSEVGSLELTQKAAASQKTQRPARRNNEQKTHSHMTAKFWQRRQYFGTSQFETEDQDPVESFEVKQKAEDEDFAPTTVSVHSSGRSVDDEFDFITITQTEPLEPAKSEEREVAVQEWNELEANGRADNQLPPKRVLSTGFEESDGLTLRPGSLSWL